MEFTEKNIFNAVKRVANWEELGIQIGFTSDELSVIKRDTSSTSEALIRLVGDWRRYDKDASWKSLARALRLAGHKVLADSLYPEDSAVNLPGGSAKIDEIAPNFMRNGSLGAENLQEIFEEIYDARGKWRNIGLKLGIDITTLDAIQHECFHNVDNCLQETLKKWLTGNYERTWSKLADVMQSKTVAHVDIAKDIRTNHCKQSI